jgi:hypothetical protein
VSARRSPRGNPSSANLIYFFAARNAAQRFFVAAAIAALPAAHILRFAFFGAAAGASEAAAPLTAAHLFAQFSSGAKYGL